MSKSILPLYMTFEKNAQAQQDISARIPLWVWILAGLLVVIIGVVWTLREEEEAKKKQVPSPQAPPPEPAPVAAQPEEAVGEAKPAPEAEPELEPIAEAEPTPVPVESETAPPKPDDLTKVSGIGPKIKQILNKQGIYTFEQLAATDISFLEHLMEEQGWRMATYTTWPEQAKKLAESK